MSILDLLSTLKNLNIFVQARENRLEIEAPDGALTPKLISELKKNKEELIKFLSKGKKRRIGYTDLKQIAEKEYYPLSSPQKRMYLLQQLDVESTAYNIPGIIYLEPGLNKDRIADIFKKLIERHESLRTSFEVVNEKAVQRIHKSEDIKFKIDRYERDKSHNKNYGQVLNLEPGISGAAEVFPENFIRPFDLGKAPLLRAGISDFESSKILMTDMHHITADGVSHQILEEEFKRLYREEELPGLKLQYKDYAHWQNRNYRLGMFEPQESYWLKKFPNEAPVLNLPTDFSRPALQSVAGGKVAFLLSPAETGAVKKIAMEMGATLYMVILSVFNILLSKLSGDEDIVVGVPIAARRHPDLERIIGMFVNTLAVRCFPSGEKRYVDFLREIKETALEAYENQEYQFEDLVDKLSVGRDTGRNPIFSVMFNLLNQGDYPADSSAKFEVAEAVHAKALSKFDLTLSLLDYGDRLYFSIVYCSGLFKPTTIDGFIRNLKKIISAVSDDTGKKISDIEIISKVEKEQLLFEFNDTGSSYPANKPVCKFFEEQAKRTPDNIALLYEDIGLSCNYLHKRIERLAGVLSSEGVSRGSIVGIMADRSPEMVLGIMAILRASAAYLPIDPAFPGDRISYILKDSNAKILLTAHKLFDDVERLGDSEVRKVFFEAIEKPEDKEGAATFLPMIAAGLPAYVIYTSGSTGFPKGVLIEHQRVVNLLLDLQQRYPLRDSDVYLLKTAYIFDVSVTELFGWFMGGGSLSILPVGGENDPSLILEKIESWNISHINFVPSMFNVFVEALTRENISKLANLRYIFLAGEALPPGMVKKFNKFSTDILLENIYGPTEATVYTCGYSLSLWDGRSDIPIGKPMRNVSLYILDKYDKPQGVGIVGELSIGGVSVAGGYLNNPGLTAEKFIEIPYLSHTTHLYKTGDLARWQPDGNIEFLGRKDKQVKIRGYRVEPGEIENHLLGIAGIKEAVVIDREEEHGYKHLCAYIVPEKSQLARVAKGQANEDFAIDIAALKNELSKELPAYMIPSYFVKIEALPLTAGGKVNRKLLPAPGIEAGAEYLAPGNELEKRLVEIWSEVLHVDKDVIGIADNFFELGGHSLRAAIMASRLHKEFNVNVRLIELFSIPTIIGIANLISIGKSRKERIIAEDDEREKVLL